MLTIFTLLVVYQLKHFAADYPLQGEYQLGKFKDGWDFFLPLLSHVAIHAGFTWLIVISFTANVNLAVYLALFDGTIHFFMDRIKAGKKYMGRWKALSASEWVEAKRRSECEWVDIHGDQITDATKPMNAIYRKQIIGNRLFWICLGIDQLIHHLTHYVCIYFILKALGKF